MQTVDYDYILITFQRGRHELKDPTRLWMDGVVPFKISNSFGSKGKGTIYLAMREIMMKTCIRFVPKKHYSNAFIFIEPGIGCRASIEKLLSGKITISRVCNSKGIIIHELMHVLGFHHEHNRPDRDEYVKINWDNIKEGAYHHFQKLPEDLVQIANFSYDYDSIMHYGSHRFSKNRGVPTIITLKKNVTIGQRKGLSQSDILKIVKLYKCTMDVEKAREDSLKTTKLADMLGDTNSFWKVVYITENN
ncbi:UNVERIFIED_CONTAM: nas-15 [Trichonephila clavipes]